MVTTSESTPGPLQRVSFGSQAFSLDLRSLALWRTVLGGLILFDIGLRMRDLQAFYGDRGVLSRRMCFDQWWADFGYQLFFSAGTTGQLLVLFGLWAVAAGCFMVGYRTRLSGFLCWFFLVFVQLRNPMILDGGDEILRVLLFWSPFLPLGARWSVDARCHPEWRELPNSYRSIATFGVYLQVSLFYLFAGILKSGEDWRETGDAVYYALSIDQFTTSLGSYLAQFPDELRPLSAVVVGLEVVLGLSLLVSPRKTAVRAAFLFLATGFHLSIAALFHLGLFMPIAIGLLTVFLPSRVWGREEPEKGTIPMAVPSGYRPGPVTQAFCAFVSFYVLYVNVYSIWHGAKLQPWTKAVASVIYQHQHWHFFAPHPFREDGFFKLEVFDQSGGVRDLFEVGPVDERGKPLLGSARFRNHRWRRWMQNLVQIEIDDNLQWRTATLEFFLTRQLAEHPEVKLESARLLFVMERTPKPGGATVLEPVVLAETVRQGHRDPTGKPDRV